MVRGPHFNLALFSVLPQINHNIMRALLLLFLAATIVSCKSTQESSETVKVKPEPQKVRSMNKSIIVDANRKPALEPDFTVLKWTTKRDTLEVIVRYTGGCKPHDFNAYFSGAWLKTLPAQALIEIEHINLENDPCRSLVKDTLKFDMSSLQYPGAKEVVVKWSADPEKIGSYRYGKK